MEMHYVPRSIIDSKVISITIRVFMLELRQSTWKHTIFHRKHFLIGVID